MSGHGRGIPRSVVLVGLSAATLGVIYGYDGSTMAGAQLYFSDYFGLDADGTAVETIVTATVYGELLGALVGGFLINRFGRKPTIVSVAICYAVFCLASAASFGPVMLGISRFLLGIAIGVSLIAVPVFIAESVPARVRGATLVAYQVAAVVGIILGYLVALAASDLGDAISWRVMVGIAALPALLLLPTLLRLPETARWLVMQQRIDEARRSLASTDPDCDIDSQLREMAAAGSGAGRLREMLRRPYLRATAFVIGLGFFIQITGINATIAYGPRIFEAMGVGTNRQSLLMAALVQCIALVAVVVSMLVVDRWGRRPILLTGIGIMIASQVALATTFATQEGDSFGTVQVVIGFLGLAGINIGFVFGFGALVWVYSSESFPARLRGYGSSAMLSADLLANIIIVQFFLTVLSAIGGAWSFAIFAILALAAWLFVFRLAPETKGRGLEEIQDYWENDGAWPQAMDKEGR